MHKKDSSQNSHICIIHSPQVIKTVSLQERYSAYVVHMLCFTLNYPVFCLLHVRYALEREFISFWKGGHLFSWSQQARFLAGEPRQQSFLQASIFVSLFSSHCPNRQRISWGPICSDDCTCCHTDIETADHTCSLTSLTLSHTVLALTHNPRQRSHMSAFYHPWDELAVIQTTDSHIQWLCL